MLVETSTIVAASRLGSLLECKGKMVPNVTKHRKMNNNYVRMMILGDDRGYIMLFWLDRLTKTWKSVNEQRIVKYAIVKNAMLKGGYIRIGHVREGYESF